MKKDDRCDAQTVRLAIVGTSGVGKSALSVRYLTKRFIGEYKSDADILYKFSTHIGDGPISVELKDISPVNSTPAYDVISMHQQWADAFVLVYSITDQQSFHWVADALEILKKQNCSLPRIILAAKNDLLHLREVEESEGRQLSEDQSCNFFEVSSANAADSITEIMEQFITTIKKAKLSHLGLSNSSPKLKLSVSKMLGSLIGKPSPPRNNITEFIVLDREESSNMKPEIRHL